MTEARQAAILVAVGYQVRFADPEALLGLRSEVFRLYRSGFAGPPYSETEEEIARFTDGRFDRSMATPGAHGFVAWRGETVAGLVYGWPARGEVPGDRGYALVHSCVAPHLHHLLRPPAFEVVELVVDPAHRRRGLGRLLLDRIVEGHATAWLGTHPDAPARRLYESAGWTVIGQCEDGRQQMLIMSLSR
ncbi:GNAT family N-acetyltransferase [Lentzea sp. DG1S-22]|uniref:GNAT family N-acetyltransferase n=1 Tax=Lentzea sp. DG1S-22 TaxID=3108822 RepID=UPI002E776EB9|nr:GNAT family N-acetyltransferase [Lentzea sp. DG1S-22]WVH81953.1 GNAT family N-acetyltransferase [Lentzea sp. DG1S-22]